MTEQKKEKKVFVQIVQQLREIIEGGHIRPGDKLPSERVLCEQLGVSRASLREALRSLELLGLIQSRHGGGNYLTEANGNHLVELLSSFILSTPQAIDDVHQTRQMHEREAVRIICRNQNLRELPIWDSFFTKIEIGEEVVRGELLKEMVITTSNRLSLKIWLQLYAYSDSAVHDAVNRTDRLLSQTVLKSMQMGYEQEAILAYDEWMAAL